MKLILSRKGFDSQSGGCPSPIFPDGTIYSLPIPGRYSKIRYRDIRHGNTNIGKVVKDLTRRRKPKDRIGSKCRAHLDPDINRSAYSPRKRGWRPLFGQSGVAQGHLGNQGVQPGDLFLFFGLFRQVEKTSGRWRFVKDAPKQHILWGWLQIGKIRKVDELAENELLWSRYHPHRHPSRGKNPTNTLYIASGQLDLGGGPIAPGAGCFPKFHERLVLTESRGVRGDQTGDYLGLSIPTTARPRLPTTPNLTAGIIPEEKYTYLRSVGRGQEFVLDLDQYPGVTDWLMCNLSLLMLRNRVHLETEFFSLSEQKLEFL